MGEATITPIGKGMYRVEENGRAELVYAAGPPGDRWAFWNGNVFHRPAGRREADRRRHVETHQALTAPMPATVLKISVEPGQTVRKGDTLLVLEAMKMELPVRAAADGIVRAVLCREGELVQAGAALAELE
jgi:biotin carboxyl carrier protein